MDEILNLIESVSEGFPSYLYKVSKFSLAPSKSHMHIFNMSATGMQGFQKDPLKTVGGVDYTSSIP